PPLPTFNPGQIRRPVGKMWASSTGSDSVRFGVAQTMPMRSELGLVLLQRILDRQTAERVSCQVAEPPPSGVRRFSDGRYDDARHTAHLNDPLSRKPLAVIGSVAIPSRDRAALPSST